jgi:hypothetical protein
MSEQVAASDTPAARTGPAGKGKQVRATDMLNRVSIVPTARIEPPVGERGRSNDAPQQERDPVPAAQPTATPAPAPQQRQRRPKPTALKLPAAITDELRAAMVYLRAHGEWDASMSQIAQAGIRYELDRLKTAHGIGGFPPVSESSPAPGE